MFKRFFICDRCSKKVDVEELEEYEHILAIKNTLRDGNTYEKEEEEVQLCPECWKALREWMSEDEGKPERKEEKAEQEPKEPERKEEKAEQEPKEPERKEEKAEQEPKEPEQKADPDLYNDPAFQQLCEEILNKEENGKSTTRRLREKAEKNGRRGKKNKNYDKAKMKYLIEDGSLTKAEIAEIMNVGYSTVMRDAKRIRDGMYEG